MCGENIPSTCSHCCFKSTLRGTELSCSFRWKGKIRRKGLPNHLVMHYLWFKLKQKILIFGIIFRGLHVSTREDLDRIQILPECKRDEMRNVIFCPFEDVNTDVALHRPIVRNGTLIHKLAICLRLCGGHFAMPHSYDHVYNSTEINNILCCGQYPGRMMSHDFHFYFNMMMH